MITTSVSRMSGRFPIPMRGSELRNANRTRSWLSVFPIPMRGSECRFPRRWSVLELEFPIPMRGSESPVLRIQVRRLSCFRSP